MMTSLTSALHPQTLRFSRSMLAHSLLALGRSPCPSPRIVSQVHPLMTWFTSCPLHPRDHLIPSGNPTRRRCSVLPVRPSQQHLVYLDHKSLHMEIEQASSA